MPLPIIETQRLVEAVRDGGAWDLEADVEHRFAELLPVLGHVDCLAGGADHLDPVPLQHAFSRQVEGAIEPRLPAHCRQQRIGPFLGDDLLDERGASRGFGRGGDLHRKRADGKDGSVTVIDTDSLEIRARIQAKPGLGPMRFSEDGRWGLVVNPAENEVAVIDASTDTLAHTISAGKQPYQVTFTRSFGYVRSLGTQDVALIPVSELDGDETPPVTYIPAGQNPPAWASPMASVRAFQPSQSSSDMPSSIEMIG